MNLIKTLLPALQNLRVLKMLHTTNSGLGKNHIYQKNGSRDHSLMWQLYVASSIF